MFDDLLVLHGAGGVQDQHDQVASTGHCDDLPASALAVFGPLDDTRQVQQLDFRALVDKHTWDAGQCGELVGSHLRERSCQLCQQG